MAIGGIGRPSTKRTWTLASKLVSKSVVIHTIRGGYWAALAGIELNVKMLKELGKCMVSILKRESTKYMARIGWSGGDPMGGPPIWDSFSYKIVGTNVEIRSTFYGMKELARGKIPARRMTWLTQAKQRPDLARAKEGKVAKRKWRLTLGKPAEQKSRPLVVPIKTGDGRVEFRTAPLKVSGAWVHPGIAKFTFFETAIRKGRKACIEIVEAKIR